jgi:signal transduction histidine kinase
MLLTVIFNSLSSCKGKQEHVNTVDDTAQINKIANHAHALMDATEPTKVLAYIQNAFAQLHNPGIKTNYTRLNLLREYYYDHQRNYLLALHYTDSCLNIIKPVSGNDSYTDKQAESLLNRGDALLKLKRYNEAYAAFYQAKLAVSKSGEQCETAPMRFNFHQKLANVSYGQSQFLEAVAQQRKAIVTLQHCHLEKEYAYAIQGAYDNIGLYLMQAGRIDEAITAYNLALEVIKNTPAHDHQQQVDLQIAKAVVFGNLGSAMLKKGKTTLAEKYFKQNIAINSKPGYANEDALITQMKLAQLYLDINYLESATAVINDIKQSKITLSEPQDNLQLLLLYAAYYKAVGDKDESIRLYEKFVADQFALRRSQVKLLNTDYGKEFDLLDRRYALAQLERENQTKTNYLIAATLICALTVIILYLVHRSRKQTSRDAAFVINYNRRLEVTLEALESSAEENDRLQRIMAHDLKNPLGVIYGMSILMLDEPGLNEEMMEMLEIVKDSSEKMNSLIIDLLTTKVDKQQQAAINQSVDLKELLKESVSLLRYRAREKQQRITFESSETCVVTANRERIWRVVNNLIVNAIKFSPTNSRIKVKVEQAEKMVTVRVKDEGIGIPPELQKKVFDLTSEAKRKGTAGEDSYGLGLYTSRQIIEAHGGKIWFDSTPGEGTVFYFTLPCVSN